MNMRKNILVQINGTQQSVTKLDIKRANPDMMKEKQLSDIETKFYVPLFSLNFVDHETHWLI